MNAMDDKKQHPPAERPAPSADHDRQGPAADRPELEPIAEPGSGGSGGSPAGNTGRA